MQERNSAYVRLNKISKGKDVHVPVSLSVLVDLIDGIFETNLTEKDELIDQCSRYLNRHPSGLPRDTYTGISKKS